MTGAEAIRLSCWLQIKLRLMQDHITSPQDWIVIADSDEFYDFDAIGPGIQVYCCQGHSSGMRNEVAADLNHRQAPWMAKLQTEQPTELHTRLCRVMSAGLKQQVPALVQACWLTGRQLQHWNGQQSYRCQC
jgi:hypothetical protein